MVGAAYLKALLSDNSCASLQSCGRAKRNTAKHRCIDNVHTCWHPGLMDEYYELSGITFVWNPDKAQSNRAKHRVTFEQAAEVFFDPFLRVVDASPERESRDAIIEMDERWTLLFVVHVEIEGEWFRIISARRATARERQIYES